MRKQTLWRTTSTRGIAVLACVLGAALGATAAAAMARSHHHHANHRRYGHGVCYTTRHHHRTRAKCSTTTTTSAPAHGHGISLLGLATLGTNQSNNWSGYNQGTIEQGSTLFHSISARWTVPKAAQAQRAVAAAPAQAGCHMRRSCRTAEMHAGARELLTELRLPRPAASRAMERAAIISSAFA